MLNGLGKSFQLVFTVTLPWDHIAHMRSSQFWQWLGKASVARISPSAKLLITEYGLDLSSLKASGSHGTLLNPHVLAAIYHHIFVLIMLFVWLILTNLLTGLYCDCG